MNDRITILFEKDAIIDTLNRLFIGTDNRDWPTVQNCLAPEVHFDMTSASGGEPVVLTPEQITDGWEAGLKGLRAIHHQVGNYVVRVNGDLAEAFCYGIASHYLPVESGRNTRVFVGSYDFELVKRDQEWKIRLFRFNLKYMESNLDLNTNPKNA